MEDLIVKTIKGPNDSEVSFCPKRGGMITSLKLNGKEILYFDEETFKNKNEAVRGGIPILFPNGGELEKNSLYPNLKRHGFARNEEWQFEKGESNFKEILNSTNETRQVFPYDFILSLIGEFEEDGSFTLKQEVKNMEKEKEMPISMGFHPYFSVPNIKKGYIKFDFKGGKEIEKQIVVWGNGGTVYIDNPKINDPDIDIKVDIPEVGIITITISNSYQNLWVWSIPGKNFICIEPMMRGLNGLMDEPLMIKPMGTFKASINFKLK